MNRKAMGLKCGMREWERKKLFKRLCNHQIKKVVINNFTWIFLHWVKLGFGRRYGSFFIFYRMTMNANLFNRTFSENNKRYLSGSLWNVFPSRNELLKTFESGSLIATSPPTSPLENWSIDCLFFLSDTSLLVFYWRSFVFDISMFRCNSHARGNTFYFFWEMWNENKCI